MEYMDQYKGFMRKEASSFFNIGDIAEGASQGAVGVIPYILGIPLAAGAATGYLTSKMTSPSDSDKEALQDRVMDVTVREELATRQRQLQATRQRVTERLQKQKEGARQRDMFV